MNLKDSKIAQSLVGEKVKFEATCELFPPQGIAGKIVRIERSKTNEILYIVKTPKRGLELSVGANTHGLVATISQ